MRRANMMSGIVLAAFGLAMMLWVIPAQIEPGPPGMMSPRLVPNLTMAAVTGLALLLVATNLRPAGPEAPGPITAADLAALARIGAIFALGLALHALVSPLAAGLGVTLGGLLALGERRWWVLALLPAVLLTGLWALFYRVLGTAIV